MTLDIHGIRRWLPQTGSLAAFLLAILLIGIGVLLRFPMDEAALEPLPPYITLYPAIVFAAFAGGLRVGFFAVLLSAAIAWLLWIAPPAGGALTPGRIMTTGVYLFTATATVLTSGTARLLLDTAVAEAAYRERITRESVHRIKNLLAVVQSISRKISGTAADVASYRDRLDSRLNALAIAQDTLLRGDWQDVQLKQLVLSTLAPFLPNPRLDMRVEVSATVPREGVTPFSMALYELATNSMKYGALSSPEGYVRVEARARDGRCFLEWHEIGLAQVAVGENAGFGSSLIRAALSGVEDGTVIYNVGPQTVSCVFEWPLSGNQS